MKTSACVLISLALSSCATRMPAMADLPPLQRLAEPERGTFASGRLAAGDMDAIQRSGIREVIDLSLDEETPGFDEAAAVRSRGMAYRNLPIGGAGDLTLDKVMAFDALLRSAGPSLLVHCASSNRVGAMAALRAAWVQGASAEQSIAIGKSWGLHGLETEVRARIQSGPAAAR